MQAHQLKIIILKEPVKKGNYIRKVETHRKKGFSANSQLRKIKEKFPNLILLKSKGKSFEIVIRVRPTPLSKQYDLKIIYDKYVGVKVFIINEILMVAKNRTKLPHVYSHIEQQICLYSPSKKEWTREKFIFSTIIPWACEWLQFYELWVIDGNWLGGGHEEYR